MTFEADLDAIRKRAREHMEEGPVTEDYRGDREQVIKVLNDVVATEIVCVLRYKRHQFTATGLYAQPVADEFAQHAAEEQAHMDMAAQRIVQLGGEPNLDPSRARRAQPHRLRPRHHPGGHGQGGPGGRADRDPDLHGDDPVDRRQRPTTRRVLETILEQEEEHADDLRDLLTEARPQHARADSAELIGGGSIDQSKFNTLCPVDLLTGTPSWSMMGIPSRWEEA